MNKIIENWNLLRMLRMGLGVAALIQGAIAKDFFAGVVGLLLTSTALFNVSCCGSGNCSSGSCSTPRK